MELMFTDWLVDYLYNDGVIDDPDFAIKSKYDIIDETDLEDNDLTTLYEQFTQHCERIGSTPVNNIPDWDD